MKLHPDHHDDLNAITAYGTGWVEVNGARHEGPLLLRPQGPVQPWPIDGLAALTPETLLALAEPRPGSHPRWAPGARLQVSAALVLRVHCCRPGIGLEPWIR